MKHIFKSNPHTKPQVSILLLDWSVRESFHTLHYLNHQTVPRETYEILWIEYYDRIAPEIQSGLTEYAEKKRPAFVDQWVVLEMPSSVYYHKHLMYNVGIVLCQGKIVVICDSDAMVKPTFVESIIKTFDADPLTVLHLDEVRNNNKKFYPFNHPSFQEVIDQGCINWNNGKTTGLLDKKDILHTRNYGACMCALREDLIRIGGADEHLDYLGHICGPYELSFRLKNAGKKEIWHESEFLFHTWHPGADGIDNYLGPHDGFNMSLRALDLLKTARILPFVENPAIRLLRMGDEILYVHPSECLIPTLEISKWSKESLSQKTNLKRELKRLYKKFKYRRAALIQSAMTSFLIWSKLLMIETGLVFQQIRFKARNYSTSPLIRKTLFDKFYLAFAFTFRVYRNNRYAIQRCEQILKNLIDEKVEEVAFYGGRPLSKIFKTLIRKTPMRLKGVYDESSQKELTKFQGKVVVGFLTDSIEHVDSLKQIGIKTERIVRLQ